MVERDRLERRGLKATIPSDLEDPPQFGQILETAKDAFVEELRVFFDQPNLNTVEVERRAEIPTARKYAVGFAVGADPYETVQQIVSDFTDNEERLPHIAVTAVQGTNNRLTAGQPIIGQVQWPPRVETTLAEPYALAGVAFEAWSLTVTAAVVGFRYVAVINAQDFEYTAVVGDTVQTIAAGLRDALRAAEPFVRLTRSGAVLTVTSAEAGTAFTASSSANITTAQVTAASTATGSDRLVLRTLPNHVDAEEETIIFTDDRFPTAAPVTAATAADVARVINEQGINVHAVIIDVGGSPGVRIQTGGPCGQGTPNEIEVRPGTSANLLAIFGLGAAAAGGGGDTLTGTPPDTNMTLASTGVGTAALAAVDTGIDAYIDLEGFGSASNNGRFRVVSAPTADSVVFENAAGAPESFAGATWFVGHRDTWRNVKRPIMNRRHLSFRLTISMSVLTESANSRDELHDLVLAHFVYFLEEKHYTLHGRTLFDEAFPDENYQISISQDAAPAGQATVPREQDAKGPIYEARVSLGCTLFWYQDRAVLVPSGPRAGETWAITSADITPQDDAGVPLNDFTVGG